MDKKKLLFIEDETSRNEAMVIMLKYNFEVDWAKSPKEACDMILKSDKYDLIILDIILPVDECFNDDEKIQCNDGDDTGLVLAKKLLNDEKTSNIPIILESARNHVNTSDLKNVKYSLAKPFYYLDLKKEIDNVLNIK